MTPARGRIVVSAPREWISIGEVEEAFCSARLHLSHAQIHLLLLLIKEFSEECSCDAQTSRVSIANSEEMKSLNTAVLTTTVLTKHKVHADWLRKYLVHLRVGERGRNWVSWLDEKIKKKAFKKRDQDELMVEFRKALGGLRHELSESDIRNLAQRLEIVPSESLDKAIQNKVSAWALDILGRMDFSHEVHVEYKKWLKENGDASQPRNQGAVGRSPRADEAKKSKAARIEEESIKKTIKARLKAEKEKSYRVAERKSADITIELFNKFDAHNKKENYNNCKNFGEWLERHLAQESDMIQKVKLDLTERNAKFRKRRSKGQFLAPYNVLSCAIDKAIQLSDSRSQHALRANALELKRSVASESVGARDDESALVLTRATFDRYFDESFYAKMCKALDEESLFFEKRQDAQNRAESFDNECKDKSSKLVKNWAESKKAIERERNEIKVRSI
jgi:hypothetical protein